MPETIEDRIMTLKEGKTYSVGVPMPGLNPSVPIKMRVTRRKTYTHENGDPKRLILDAELSFLGALLGKYTGKISLTRDGSPEGKAVWVSTVKN